MTAIRNAALFLSLVPLISCSLFKESGRDPNPRFRVEEIGLEIPALPGWKQDSTKVLQDGDAGGIALRLMRDSSVVGSPRIDVVIEKRNPVPTSLEGYLNKNLREMAALEDAGQLRVTGVDQRIVNVGPRRAHRVRHEYTMGEGNNQLAITQVSLFMVLDGRGVTVSASGRTELFHPLAGSVDQILNGLSTPANADKRTGATKLPDGTEPIDLGSVGGKDDPPVDDENDE